MLNYISEAVVPFKINYNMETISHVSCANLLFDSRNHKDNLGIASHRRHDIWFFTNENVAIPTS